MKRKSITIFITGNEPGQTRRLNIPVVWIHTVLFVLVMSSTMLIAGVVDYFGLLVQSVENKRLVAENSQLKKKFEIVESKVSNLESSLERVKTFYMKLRRITNVPGGEGMANSLAVGPIPPTARTLEQARYDRYPSNTEDYAYKGPGQSNLSKTFYEERPVNAAKSELAVENRRQYASLAIRIDRAIKETQLRETNVLELWETLSQQQSLLIATPSIKPVRGWVTSRFDYRVSPFTGRVVMHNGLDIAASPGTPVMASAEGVVSYAGFDSGYGKLVSIDHGFGMVTRYGHNSKIYVKIGQRVKRGDIIAAVGSTGRSTGPHLHYEVRVNNVPMDPSNYILIE